jgi:hypothetical protein
MAGLQKPELKGEIKVQEQKKAKQARPRSTNILHCESALGHWVCLLMAESLAQQ